MTFLEHGDIRKSGRAIIIASTILVLLNECSENFKQVDLFGFKVRISHEMLTGFINIGIWILAIIFFVRFVQGFSDWEKIFAGKKALEERQSVLVNEVCNKIENGTSRNEAINYTKNELTPLGTKRLRAPEFLEKEALINFEYRKYFFRRAGDLVDALILQLGLPLASAVYALWLSPALMLICTAAN